MLVVALLAALSLQDRLGRIDTELKAGRFEAAQQELRGLTGTIAEHFGSGSQAMYTVAVIATFRAIAAAGLGNVDDAEWYWNIARSLYPPFHGTNLHVYGTAGDAVMRIDASESCDMPSPPPSVTPPRSGYGSSAAAAGAGAGAAAAAEAAEARATRAASEPPSAWPAGRRRCR